MPELPGSVGALLLITTPLQRVVLADPAQPELLLSLADSSEVYLLGYATPARDLGVALGPLETVGDLQRSVPLPEAPSNFRLGSSAEPAPLAFSELPAEVRATRLPLLPFRPCLVAERCAFEREPGFCVPCAAATPPAPATRPAPPQLGACASLPEAEALRCLGQGDPFGLHPGCAGLDTPLACHPTPSCQWTRVATGPDHLWVPGTSAAPQGASTFPDLDAALGAAQSSSVTIHLGAGRFSAALPIGAAVRIVGRCPAETELLGPLAAAGPHLERLRVSGAVSIIRDRQAEWEEVELGAGPPLVVEGQLYGARLTLGRPIVVTGTLTLDGAALGFGLEQRGGRVELRDVRAALGAGVVQQGGSAAWSEVDFAGQLRPLVHLRPGTSLEADHLVLRGELRADSEEGDLQLDLSDVLVIVPEGLATSGLWIESAQIPPNRLQEAAPCPRSSQSVVRIQRLMVHEPGPTQADDGADGIRLNCTQVELGDVRVDGFGREEGIFFGLVDGTAERLLVTNRGIDSKEAAAQVRAEETVLWTGPGVRVRTPEVVTEIPPQHLTLRDVTTFLRRRGLFLQGLLPTSVERAELYRGRSSALAIENREAPTTLSDLVLEGAIYDQPRSSLAAGHGLVLAVEPPYRAGPIHVERFVARRNQTAGLFLEGDLWPSTLRSGEVLENGIGLQDLNDRDLTPWLQSVRFYGNESPFGPSAE